MRSLILTLSYLLKDTWLRWFEQPGSVLARVLVTVVMTALSMVLLVSLSLQIQRLEQQVESFGLDNVIVIESIRQNQVEHNLLQNRFDYLKQWGEVVTIEKLPNIAYGGGKRVNVMAYGESALPSLSTYLNKGHNYFLLTKDYPQGALIDFEVDGQYLKAVCLEPDSSLEETLPANLLFVPLEGFRHLTENGFSRMTYLQKSPEGPSLKEITTSIERVVATDRSGDVEVRSALSITERLQSMREQLNKSTIWLSLALGGALALIYGTLSLLEFRQSMYISALLNSFGANKAILFIRTLLENLVIANITAIAVIYALSKNHDSIVELLKLHGNYTPEFLNTVYWGDETLWLVIFINIGVALSCIPVMLAMRKQVGLVLS